VHHHGNDAGGVVLAGSPPTTTTRAGRIHDALGVDPIHFESGYPKLV
jgi:hypothetical protein